MEASLQIRIALHLSITQNFFSLLRYFNLNTPQKMKISIKDFCSISDQICSFLEIWSHLLNKSLMENIIFCAVWVTNTSDHGMVWTVLHVRGYHIKSSNGHYHCGPLNDNPACCDILLTQIFQSLP